MGAVGSKLALLDNNPRLMRHLLAALYRKDSIFSIELKVDVEFYTRKEINKRNSGKDSKLTAKEQL